MRVKTWATAFFVVITVLYGTGLTLTLIASQPLSLNEALFPVFHVFAVVGCLIAWKRPGNVIAWICLAIGFVWGLEAALVGIATYGLAHPGSVPLPETLAALGVFLWVPGVFGLMFVFMFFPDGRLPSSRWRWLPWTAATAIAGSYLVLLLSDPEVYGYGRDYLRIDNPLARIPEFWSDLPTAIGIVALVASIVAMVVRFRRSRGIERQQLKWLATAGSSFLVLVIPLVLLVVDLLGDRGENVGLIVFGFSIVIPISIGMAVLRYRLYEIDRLIRRTVTYTLVAGLLAGVFAVIAIGLPRLIGIPEENPIVVAGATLAAAALFNPLRLHVQRVVDRRFNRARYDARQEVEHFSERLRANVEMDDLTDQVVDVVSKTVQPASVAVWVREQT